MPEHNPSTERKLGLRVVRGVSFTVGRKLVMGPLALLVVPFSLHKLGAPLYGSWIILATIINLGSILDIGLGATVTKFVAEHKGKNDPDGIRKVVNAACASYLLITVAVLSALLSGAQYIVRQFFVGPNAPVLREILALWPLVLATVAADLLAKPFASTLTGLQRLDLVNMLMFGTTAANISLTVLFLLAGQGLGGLLSASLISASLYLCGTYVSVTRMLPHTRPNPLKGDLHTARSLFSFSAALYASSTMASIQDQIEKLYLARFAGVVPVALYGMASDAASKVRRLPDLLLRPVMAASSELHSANDQEKLSQLHFRAHKYLAFSLVPLVSFALLYCKPLVVLWLGPAFSPVAFPFAILVTGNFFQQIGGPTYFTLVGQGALRPGMYGALVAAVLNVILSFLFITRWGFGGAAAGTAIPMVLSTIYFFALAKRYLRDPLLSTLQLAYFKPLISSTASCFITYCAMGIHATSWSQIAMRIALYSASYCSCLLWWKFFDAFDLTRLKQYAPLPRSLRSPAAQAQENA